MHLLASLSLVRLLPVVALGFALAGSAVAGPLRDRIAERVAERGAQMQAQGNAGASAAKVLRNVAYGPDKDQPFDVYLPERPQHAPVIFMVHGGGWRRGDKEMGNVTDSKAARWLPKGIILVSVNYPMTEKNPDSQTTNPRKTDPLQQARDVARALAAAQGGASSWGGDPDKFILMGHSAGAHLVALIDASPAVREGLTLRPWLGTVSLDSGTLDVAAKMEKRHARLFDQAFGDDRAYWEAASPQHNARAVGAPFLAVCSSTRPDDSCGEAARYTALLNSLGTRASVLREPLSHSEINKTLGLPGAYTEAVEGFLAGLHPDLRALLLR